MFTFNNKNRCSLVYVHLTLGCDSENVLEKKGTEINLTTASSYESLMNTVSVWSQARPLLVLVLALARLLEVLVLTWTQCVPVLVVTCTWL